MRTAIRAGCVFALGLILTGALLGSIGLVHGLDEAPSSNEGQLTARARFTLPKLFDFQLYKTLFNKQYTSLVEEAARARLFVARAFQAFVSAISYKQRKDSSYLAINHMSDWTPQELRSIYIKPGTLPEMFGRAERAEDPAEPEQKVEEEAPFPALSLDEVERELSHIIENLAGPPELRQLIAKELGKPAERRRRRRDTASSDTSRALAWSDVMHGPASEPVEVGERIASNNPDYEPPELVSFGLFSVLPMPPIPNPVGALLNYLPGRDFITWVLNKAVEVWSDAWQEDSDDEEDPEVRKPDEMFIDLRDECMFAPRDQGRCGSCYAFASIAVYEWMYCKLTGKKVAFSEQYLVDCGTDGLSGCEGGFTHKIPNFVRKRGLELLSNYPYRARADQCPYRPTTPESAMGYLRVATDSLRYIPDYNFERELKKAPMVITLYCSDSFSYYGGGVYDGRGCSAENAHAITLVGSGREDNEEYWLLRNSYSANWGQRGYYKLNKKASKRCIEHQEAYQFRGLRLENGDGVNPRYQPEAVMQRNREYKRKHDSSWRFRLYQ